MKSFFTILGFALFFSASGYAAVTAENMQTALDTSTNCMTLGSPSGGTWALVKSFSDDSYAKATIDGYQNIEITGSNLLKGTAPTGNKGYDTDLSGRSTGTFTVTVHGYGDFSFRYRTSLDWYYDEKLVVYEGTLTGNETADAEKVLFNSHDKGLNDAYWCRPYTDPDPEWGGKEYYMDSDNFWQEATIDLGNEQYEHVLTFALYGKAQKVHPEDEENIEKTDIWTWKSYSEDGSKWFELYPDPPQRDADYKIQTHRYKEYMERDTSETVDTVEYLDTDAYKCECYDISNHYGYSKVCDQKCIKHTVYLDKFNLAHDMNLTPDDGTLFSKTIDIGIKSNYAPGSLIFYYTTNGKTPSTSSAKAVVNSKATVDDPVATIHLESATDINLKIRAYDPIAKKWVADKYADMESSDPYTYTTIYKKTIDYPTISIDYTTDGLFSEDKKATIHFSGNYTVAPTFYYTLDGQTPDYRSSSSTMADADENIADLRGKTIRAYARQSDGTYSTVTDYTVTEAAAPSASAANGGIVDNEAIAVTLTAAPGQTQSLYYRVGENPQNSYSTPFDVSAAGPVYFCSVQNGFDLPSPMQTLSIQQSTASSKWIDETDQTVFMERWNLWTPMKRFSEDQGVKIASWMALWELDTKKNLYRRVRQAVPGRTYWIYGRPLTMNKPALYILPGDVTESEKGLVGHDADYIWNSELQIFSISTGTVDDTNKPGIKQ